MSDTQFVNGPDFLCIGARKTGTTWLYAFLRQHPGCRMPKVKEINFFNSALFTAKPGNAPEKALAAKWEEMRKKKHLPADAPIPEDWRTNPLRWYLRSFRRAAGLVSGDVSPLYQDIPANRIAAIREALPKAKVIYILRHPMERVLSDFSMLTNNRGIDVTALDDDACFRLLEEHYASSIRYADILAAWEQHFPVDVLWYEQLRQDPAAFSAGVCTLLGLEPMPSIADETKNPNPSRSYGPRPSLSAGVQKRLAARLLPEAEAIHRRFGNAWTTAWVADIQRKAGA